MKIIVSGKEISLNKNEYLASGGEGSIYIKNNTAIKIYADPSKMIPDGKIQELSALTFSNIIKPEVAVYDIKNNPIGYTMRFIKDSQPLCKIFTKAFKKRNNITPKISLKLIENMKSTLDHIHSNNILVVDFNEMNFLTDSSFNESYFIDVDSYQTKHYKATALMESVRDRHSKKNHFDRGTDWFSFAVVTFQIMSGIHPYKGKHPSLNGFEDRMKANMSVFNSEVSLPKAVSDFKNLIPKSLQEWYYKTFEDGLRCAPPEDFVNSVVAKAVVMQNFSGNKISIDVLKEMTNDITYYSYNRGTEIICDSDKAHYGSMTMACGNNPVVGIYSSNTVICWKDKNELIINSFLSGRKQHTIEVDDYMSFEGRIYYKIGDHLMELDFVKSIPTSRVVGYTMEYSSKMFQGVSFQNMLGKFVATHFPSSGIAYQVKLKQLEGYRIIDAKMEKNILTVIGVKKGVYDQYIFSVNESEITSVRKIADISYNGINLAVLDSGVGVIITDDDKIEVFYTNKVNQITSIEDKAIHGNMKLYSRGGKIAFTDGNVLYKMQMK